MLNKIINQITKPRVKYEPLIKVLVFKNSIIHNLHAYQTKYPNLQFAPVLKSNAYGHGLVEVARILEGKKLPFFVVDSFYEALVLRRSMVKSKILIIGYTRQQLMQQKTLKDIAFTIVSLDSLRDLSANLKKPCSFHLKIDTGMHRQGILSDEMPQAAKLIKSNPNIVLEGICSHFADADSVEETFTKKQIGSWNAVVKLFREYFPHLKYFHAAATAGLRYADQIEANIARLGIGLYGINPSPDKIGLKPTLEMRSTVSSLKTIPAGQKVGYNITFESDKPLRIANIPAGYNEGIDLRLSNKGAFRVHGKLCPIIGRVSMNITTIDVTEIADAKLEDEVIIIIGDETSPNSVENIAKICHTIPYEIFIHIPQYLRRIVV